MITKDDCLSILIKIEDQGININQQVKKLLVSKEIPIEVLKFIAQNRGMDVIDFYEMLRKKHNKNKSPLYTDIIRSDEIIVNAEIILTSLLQQIALYSNKLEDSKHFIKEVRAEEIAKTLQNYFKDGYVNECEKLIKLIRTDLLVLEYINGRRDLS